MNIFAIDLNPKLCAEYHVDKHVVKMITEYVQLLSTTAYLNGYSPPMKPTHHNHISRRWLDESRQNVYWLQELLHCLHKEWQFRYGHPETKLHKSYQKWIEFSESNPGWENCLPAVPMTPVSLCMPDRYKGPDVVKSYREMYRYEKAHLHSWKKRLTPIWIED